MSYEPRRSSLASFCESEWRSPSLARLLSPDYKYIHQIDHLPHSASAGNFKKDVPLNVKTHTPFVLSSTLIWQSASEGAYPDEASGLLAAICGSWSEQGLRYGRGGAHVTAHWGTLTAWEQDAASSLSQYVLVATCRAFICILRSESRTDEAAAPLDWDSIVWTWHT